MPLNRQPEANADNSMNDDNVQLLNDSSIDSNSKGEENNLKKGSDKEECGEESDKKESDKEESDKEESDKEKSDKEKSDKEESDKEESDREESDKEEKDKEERDKEEIDKAERDKEESEQEDSEKEEEESEEEMGLLDRPVEVSGCRARKQVERLDVSFSSSKEKKHEIEEGSGLKLGCCPRIELQITKHPATDLQPLHRVLFSKTAGIHNIKKNIRKFSGFTFDIDSKAYGSKKSTMEKFNMNVLRSMCEILDLERSGTKEDIIHRILGFLLEPKDSGKALPTKKKSTSRDKKRKPAKKNKTAQKKKKAKVVVEEDSDKDDSVKESNESEDEDDKGKEEEDSDYESKKKSKSTPKKKTPSKAKATKNEKQKKVSSKSTKRKRDSSPESSDDEPVSKKSNMPSDEEMKKLIKGILENANLEEITMKKVIKEVHDNYPDCDLSHKKAFIKATIKSLIS